MDWGKLAICFVLCQGAGAIGAFSTASSVKTWYRTIRKPSWNPPSWVFVPVWTLLYTMMALALTFIWQKGETGADIHVALAFFMTQLVLNAIWSYLFFGLRKPGAALFDILMMWLFIVLSMWAFYPLDVRAFWLMAPYLAWVTFAAVLNGTLARLNPGLGGALPKK
jgi:tryptophan-rich sensory protein